MLYLVINELTTDTQVTILILEKNMATNTTIDLEDKDQFDAIAEQWWNPTGSLKSLHQFTPIRIEQLLSFAARITSLTLSSAPMFPGFILKQAAPASAASMPLL